MVTSVQISQHTGVIFKNLVAMPHKNNYMQLHTYAHAEAGGHTLRRK